MIVELPNGQELEFPDNTPPEVMRNAIYKHFPEYAAAEDTQRQPSIREDIRKSISDLPGAFVSALVDLPEQALSSGSQIYHHPLRASENIAAGLLEGLKGAANIPSNIASYLESRNIGRGGIEDFIKSLRIPDTGLEKAVLGEDQEGDELLRAIGSFAPYARAGGLAKGLGGATRRAGAASAYAAGQEEDPLKAALLGLGAEGVTRGIQEATRGRSFLPSSPLSAEELREAADITRGTETSLGNVIENPFLQRQFENVLPNIPLSGANQAMQRTANEITSRGENLLDSLKGERDISDIGTLLRDALKSSESEARKIKTEKFDVLNEAAEKEGIRTNRANMREAAQEALRKIDEDPDLALFTDASTKRMLENLSTSKGKKDYSLKQTDLLRGELGDLSHDAYSSNNTKLSTIFNTLKKSAEKDINESIDKADMPHLNALRDEAMNFYKKEYVPFEEPEIMKFTKKGGDPDLLISTFLKRSPTTDRGKLLQKLSTKLTDHDRKLIAYSYFSKALEDGKLNPLKFKTLYKNLGEQQKNILLGGDKGVKQFSDYSKLVQKNTEPLNLMFNPKTGQRALSEYLLSALTGSTGALATGNLLGGILGGLAPGLIARPIVKGLTSPSRREKLIERMIAAREEAERPQRNLAPFAQALMEVSQ